MTKELKGIFADNVTNAEIIEYIKSEHAEEARVLMGGYKEKISDRINTITGDCYVDDMYNLRELIDDLYVYQSKFSTHAMSDYELYKKGIKKGLFMALEYLCEKYDWEREQTND